MRAPVTTAAPRCRLTLLGNVRIETQGRVAPTALPRKAQALLAVVALSGRGGIGRERVAAWLWPDSGTALARQSLRQALTALRRVDDALLRDEGGRLVCDESAAEVDALQLRQLAEADVDASLEAAVALYVGPLLDGLEIDGEDFMGWLAGERAAIAATVRSAAARLAARYEAAGRWHDAVRIFERMLVHDPVDEGAWQGVIRARLRAGEPALALGAYGRCREAMQRTLAVLPGPLTRALAEQARLAMAPPGQALPEAARSQRGHGLPKAVDPAPPGTWREAHSSVVVLDFEAETPAMVPRALALSRRLAGELARRPGVAVMAGRYALAGVAPEDAARQRALLERGVDWVLCGALECNRAGDAVRLALQLVWAHTGRLHWSRTVPWPADGDDADALAALAAALELPLAMRPPGEADGDGGPWTHWRLAQAALFARGWSESAVRTAVDAYRRAIDADPGLAAAHAHLALVLAIGGKMGLVRIPEAAAEARAAAEQAIALAPFDSEVLGYAGCAIADLGEPARGEPLLERAVEENPSNPQAWSALGACRLSLNRTAEGVDLLGRGLRLAPADYRRTVWLALRSRGLLGLGRLAEAHDAAREAVRTDVHFYPAHLALAAAQHRLQRPAEAMLSLIEALRIRPRLQPVEARPWVGPRMALRLQALWAAASGAVSLPARAGSGVP